MRRRKRRESGRNVFLQLTAMHVELALGLLLSTLLIQVLAWIGSDALAAVVRSPPSLSLSSLPSHPTNLEQATQVYTPFAPTSKANKDKKAHILKLRAELAATSSQDEFSKWARLRRQLDKAVADLETSSEFNLPSPHVEGRRRVQSRRGWFFSTISSTFCIPASNPVAPLSEQHLTLSSPLLFTTDTATVASCKAFSTKFKSALWIATTVIPFIISSYHRKSPVFFLPPGWFGPLGWWLSLPSAPAGTWFVLLFFPVSPLERICRVSLPSRL